MATVARAAEAHIEVRDLTMAYGSFVLQRDLTFTVRRGDIFIIMGGSGCGKSTLLPLHLQRSTFSLSLVPETCFGTDRN
jgi:ABC-type transporter Mla maintaining outer membrane lipid asymmetry ATPase subunit MlaF